jgi:PTS system N-acetylglucosamine-specific IIC component
VVDLGAGSIQVVLGPIADQVAGRIRAALNRPGQATGSALASNSAANTPALLAALGGRANVSRLELGADRLLLQVHRQEDLDAEALRALGVRAVAFLKDGALQLLLGPAAAPMYTALRAAIES